MALRKNVVRRVLMCQGIEATLMVAMLSGGLNDDALICHYCWAVFSISCIVATVAFLLIAGEIITQLRGATNQQQQQNPEPQSMRENLALYISRLRGHWNWNDTILILLCAVFCGVVLSMSYELPGVWISVLVLETAKTFLGFSLIFSLSTDERLSRAMA
ncbi:hypothetical protein SUGI_0541680 [Cryptomeria japonica]|nr:hypothetical protein SUGI_0541680 [Cryptomeria japonica]